MRIAGIDIGSNSVRMLVADVEGDSVVELATRRVATRLGEGINDFVLRDQAVARTLDALDVFLGVARSLKPDAVVAVATSAVRDAQNRVSFLKAVRCRLGLEVRVLDGPEEAGLSWRGVRCGLHLDVTNMVVMDVGGGSTEFTWGGDCGVQSVSLRAGAVRLTEAGLVDTQVADLLAPALSRIRSDRPSLLVGVGGTISTACAMKMGVDGFYQERLHGQRLSRADVETLITMVEGRPLLELGNIKGLAPERADIISAGLSIVARALDGLRMDFLVVSETGLLYGLVLGAA